MLERKISAQATASQEGEIAEPVGDGRSYGAQAQRVHVAIWHILGPSRGYLLLHCCLRYFDRRFRAAVLDESEPGSNLVDIFVGTEGTCCQDA